MRAGGFYRSTSMPPPGQCPAECVTGVLVSFQPRTSEVMLAAVKCKQNVDPALADALDAAVAEMGKMRPQNPPVSGCVKKTTTPGYKAAMQTGTSNDATAEVRLAERILRVGKQMP